MILKDKTLEEYEFDTDTYTGNSLKYCILKCDICEKEYEKQFYLVKRGRKKIKIDSCGSKECAKEKTRLSNLKKYGTESPNSSEEVKQKKKQSYIKRYGVDNPMKNKTVQENLQKSIKKKYGTKHVMQNKDIIDKTNQTKIDRYGTHSVLGIADKTGKGQEVRSKIRKNFVENTLPKIRKNNLEKYGTEHPTQSKAYLKVLKKKNLEKHGKEWLFQTQEFIDNQPDKRMSFEDIKKLCEARGCEPVFTYDEYERKTDKYKFRCLKHDFVFEKVLSHLKFDYNQCPKCRNYTSSRQEDEMCDFISSFYKKPVERHYRGHGIEYDIYFPEDNVAIEHNGLYWHCEINKPDKKYHLNKFNKAKENNVLLLQFFEDDWRDRQDICKSVIKHKLGFSSNKIFARKCIYDFIDSNADEIKYFFENNHLQGHVQHKCCFVLRHPETNEILTALSLRSPFTKKHKGGIEIARLATKKDWNIPGGFQKLLKKVFEYCKENNYKKLITYSDCCISIGNAYKKAGFEFKGMTPQNYWYVVDTFTRREGRFKHRARDGKSERELAEEKGIHRIYSVGHYLWEYSFNE